MQSPRLWLALVAVVAFGASVATTERVEAEDPPKPADGTRRCVVTGRIVDGWERAVPGAKIAWVGDSPAGDLSTGETVLTDTEGRFRLELEGPAGGDVRGLLHATRGSESAALVPIIMGVGDRVQDMGSIPLWPARPLEVEARREVVSVPDARVWLWCWVGDMYRGSPAFVGSARTDPSGNAEFAAIPRTYARLDVQAPDGSVGERLGQIVPGSAASRLRIDLVPSRAISVLVTTDAALALPIEGAVVTRRFEFSIEDVMHSFEAHVPKRTPPTPIDGRVRVEGLPADRTIELIAHVAGRPAGTAECGPGEDTATIVVPKPTMVALQEGERPLPADGTKVLVRGRRTKRTAVEGWIENGSIAVPLRKHEIDYGVAMAPDGPVAPLKGVEPTSFFRPRSLVVRIVEAGGGGIAGTGVSLAPSPYIAGPWDTPIPADNEGQVRFDGLAPVKHVVYAFPTGARLRGTRVDEVDLRLGDATRELVVGAERAILARVTVDGRSAIPERFRWTIANGIVVDSAVDLAAGTVRIRVRPERGAPDAGSVEFAGEGVRPREVAFAWPAPGETTSIDVALFASPEVFVDVRADPESDADVYLEKWCPWNWESPWLASHERYPHLLGHYRLDLDIGRYRLHDARTGAFSDPFDVPERGQRVVATLDLTGFVTIRGRIEVPAAAKADEVQLLVEGDGIDSHVVFTMPFGAKYGVRYDGKSFAVRVPAGRPVTLSPWHDTLQPARDGGEATLVGPREDVVLRMGNGATLVVKLADSDGMPLSAEALAQVQIAAVPADHPSRASVVRRAKPVEGKPGTVSASGLPFGTLDLWIATDFYGGDGYAVRRVTRVPIAEDVVDLGEVRLTPGSRVVIRRVDKADGPLSIDEWHSYAVPMFGSRQRLFISRSAADPDAVGQFESLGAGRWYIAVEGTRRTPIGDVQEKREFEIDVDGEHDQTLDVDFSEPPASMPR